MDCDHVRSWLVLVADLPVTYRNDLHIEAADESLVLYSCQRETDELSPSN